MNIAFAGGGTGGHLFPGLSLAEELRRRDPEAKLLFLCTERDRGYQALRAPWLEVAVLRGSHRGSPLRRLASLVPAAYGAMRALRRFGPDAVVGLGGYGSVAPVLCAKLLRVPTVVLEQNVIPGRSNRLLSRVVDEVAVQWAESAYYFPRVDRIRVTGNPIRSSIQRREREAAAAELQLDPGLPTLLVMGGSQGARPLNDLVVEALPFLERAGKPLQFVHLAGSDDREPVAAAYEQSGMRACVVGFLDAMALAYSVCDLALSRAGGTSIAELTALGIPMVLVPYPHAADHHQHFNARVVEHRGAGHLLEQSTLSARRLARHLIELLGDPARLAHMTKKSQEIGVPRAACVVADRLLALADGRPGALAAAARPV